MTKPTKMTGKKQERADSSIVDTVSFQLILATNLIARPFSTIHGVAFNMSLPEWRCLMWIASHPGQSGEETANGIGMDKMSASRNLRSLKGKNYVWRKRSEQDQKRWCWRLTEEGWAAYDQIRSKAIERDRHIMSAISASERKTMQAALEKIIQSVRD